MKYGKCKNCLSHVGEDVEICPYCGYEEKEKKKISKNVVFPAKLSYQEQYPETNIYETPEYINEIRKKKELRE